MIVLDAAAIVLILIVALATIADRSARASAWRQIALERRWDSEYGRPRSNPQR